MARGTKIANLSLPPEVFEEVERLAREENTSMSEVPRVAPRQHARALKLWQQIYCWGEESAAELGIKDEAQVDEFVHQFRREQTKT